MGYFTLSGDLNLVQTQVTGQCRWKFGYRRDWEIEALLPLHLLEYPCLNPKKSWLLYRQYNLKEQHEIPDYQYFQAHYLLLENRNCRPLTEYA